MNPLPGKATARLAPVVNVGDVVADKYRVVRLIGRGGMGHVYQVEALLGARQFALKTMNAALAGNPQATARFQREARAVSPLRCENLIEVIDYGLTEQGMPFLVMPLLEGEDLATRLLRGPMTVGESAEIGISVCRALAIAHADNIVHRDLKPHNIFLCTRAVGDPQVKVLDFGVAKIGLATSSDSVNTETGALVGTPAYMAPEQLLAASDVDQRCDIFALGAVLFECLTGQRAFPSRSYETLVERIGQKASPRIDALVTGVPSGLSDAIAKAMEKHPKDRYPSAQAFATALNSFCVSNVTARPRNETTTSDEISIETGMTRTVLTGLSPVRSSRIHRIVLRAIPIAVVLVAIGLLINGDRENIAELDTQFKKVSTTTPPHQSSVSIAEKTPPPEATADTRPSGIVVSKLRSPQRRPKSGPSKVALIKSTPTPTPPTNPVDADLAVARRRLAAGETVGACNAGENTLAKHGESPSLMKFLGQCFMRAGLPEKAKVHYRRYLFLAPDAADAPFIKAIVSRNQ